MSAVPAGEGRERPNIGRLFRDNPAIVLTFVFIGLFVITDIVNRAQNGHAFLTPKQFSTTFLYAAVLGLIAAGQTLVMLTGGVDLSVATTATAAAFTVSRVGEHGAAAAIAMALVILIVIVAVIWIPIRTTRVGLALYAIGSNRNAAYLAGVNVSATRILAYALSGTFAALGGVALTAASSLGDPNSGRIYTLNSVAAVVLGGVSLLGGVGGLVGPIAAAFVLTLVKTILILKGGDQNWAQVIQGASIGGVLRVGGWTIRQKGKTGG